MNNLKTISWLAAGLASVGVASGASAQDVMSATAQAPVVKLTAMPAGWDTSFAGSPLPNAALHGEAFMVKPRAGEVGADGTSGVDFYAPIHPRLGTGTLAQPTNQDAIVFPRRGGMNLNTLNPSSSGAGGTDVNVQTIDNHSHGFSCVNCYWEISAELPIAHGSHAGIWFDGVQTSQGHGEIDFPETYGDADRVATMAHHFHGVKTSTRFPPGDLHVSNYWVVSKTPGVFYGASHAYGVYFTPTEIYTYIDRQEVARTPRLPEEAGPWYLLMSVFTDANRKDGYDPATMHIWNVYVWGR